MEKIVLLSLVVTMLTAEASAYKQEDLDKPQDTYNCVKCDLRGAILREANLTGANLYKADLRKADLSQVILYKASLHKANLYRANLKKADLKRANLFNALSRGAMLDSADLMDAKFCNTILLSGNPTFKDC